MSEASGIILLKTKEKLYKNFIDGDGETGSFFLEPLFAEAGLTEFDYDPEDLEFDGEDLYFIERVEVKNGTLVLDVIGYEWMPVLKLLAKKAKGIELYGSVQHEHGFAEYYALNAESKSFFAVVDTETGDDVTEEQAVIEQWLSFVPAAVQKDFPEAFPQ